MNSNDIDLTAIAADHALLLNRRREAAEIVQATDRELERLGATLRQWLEHNGVTRELLTVAMGDIIKDWGF